MGPVRAEHSRSIRLAAQATGESESRLERRLARAVCAVSLDPDLAGALETAGLLIETLARGPGRVELDPAGLNPEQIDSLLGRAKAIAGDAAIGVAAPRPEAIGMRISTVGPPGTVRVIPDGHGVRLSRAADRLSQHRGPSSLGVMLAAAFAAGEVFKAAAAVKESRCQIPERLDFCPVSLSEDLDSVPIDLPGTIELALIGLGAIGTATARILAGLADRASEVLLVDPEIYAEENLGTYSLGTPVDVASGIAKVDLVARALDGWKHKRHQGPVGELPAMIDSRQISWPRLAIAGLDSIEARHAAQGIWPERLIDAATGDTSLGLSDAVSGGPCLYCFFIGGDAGGPAAAELSRLLGLPIELVMRGQKRLEPGEIAHLPEKKRARLLPHLGKPICGLVSALELGANEEDGYRPSVPFVSQQAACLAVGRLVAHYHGIGGLPNALQYNAMIGPGQMTRMWRKPRPECRCQQRAEVIKAVRDSRRHGRELRRTP
jgi:hypothetical protein